MVGKLASSPITSSPMEINSGAKLIGKHKVSEFAFVDF